MVIKVANESKVVRISRSKKGKMKAVYEVKGSRRATIFEPMSENILQTTFAGDGGILDQRLLRVSKSNIENIFGTFVNELGAARVLEEDYSDIKLEKNCPKCASSPLVRYIDTLMYPSEVPVMPFYICQACGAKSYYITDSYLSNMISENRDLFSEAELSQMEADQKEFIADVKAHIIRIFASKRIMYVK
jgi:hypothetical protein